MAHLDFFPVDWSGGDSPGETDKHFRVIACGKTADGRGVCARIRFTPYFFVKAPAQWTHARAKLWLAELCQEYGALTGPSCVVDRKTAWGFTNNTPHLYIQLAFATHAAMREARFGLRRRKYETCEGAVQPLIRFYHVARVDPAGWVRVSKHWAPTERASHEDIEIETSYEHVGASDCVGAPPLVIGSFDIECYSESGGFPKESNPGDAVIQISTAFQRFGESEPYLRSVVCLHDTDAVEGVEIVSEPTEAAVMNTWMDVLRRERVDILIGWNTHQFDWKYIQGRSLVCVDDETGEDLVGLDGLGKMREGGGEVLESELSSSAYGQNFYYTLRTPGVLQIDVMQWFKKNRNLDSYALDSVSRTFLGSQKLDLPAAEIFRKFLGSSADRADIARYAVRDTELPLQLLTKLGVLQELFEMANAVKVPVEYLNSRGQQVRVFSLLIGKARDRGFVIPDDKAIVHDKFEGATVLEPRRGAYLDDPICVLDYASRELRARRVSICFPPATPNVSEGNALSMSPRPQCTPRSREARICPSTPSSWTRDTPTAPAWSTSTSRRPWGCLGMRRAGRTTNTEGYCRISWTTWPRSESKRRRTWRRQSSAAIRGARACSTQSNWRTKCR